ncbi:amidohydrolase [Conexibacter woesei]|uniref:Amidohydrolase 3 n=1 Tax=Conexibacter woesei (strain DSM 14684 / CCUG 47730 / CIP 108061 / JCM 11494 / NBRC 100937 / ID131577) TaxID=469383 RepID=D3F2J9_CONWI|nr:amidohydrolase family protein [Conexibacter woesei]ADB52265.1 Amidohydrolase 3 [Conexibacter woesei DSM 14684]
MTTDRLQSGAHGAVDARGVGGAGGARDVTMAIVGADVLTLDPARPRASAVAVAADGTIAAVGDDAEIRARCGARTELVDGAGLTVTPGLVDGHVHPVWGAKLARGVELRDVHDVAGLRDALLAERARLGPQALVRGWALDYAVLHGVAFPGELLAELAGGPALVSYFDLHTHVATPSAIAAAGVTAPIALDGNSAVAFADGRPTGELIELPAYWRISDALDPLGPDELRANVRAHLRRFNALGLTGGHAMDGDLAAYALLDELEAAGDLTLRLVVPLLLLPETGDDGVEELLRHRDDRGTLWRGGVAKFFADGVIETGTAWLEQPDSRGGGGDCYWPDPRRLHDLIVRFARAGFQCATHAIGDRAVRMTLDAYAAAAAAGAPALPGGALHRIEHLEVLPDALLRRCAGERVVASMQPLHGQWRPGDRSDEWTLRLGAQRSARAWRIRDVVDAGVPWTLGSDWPVAQVDPLLGVGYARARRLPGHPQMPVLDPEQALSPLEALAGYTTRPAATVGEAARGGRVAPGMRADLTVLDGDPTTVEPDALAELGVALTVVGGRVVHRRG